MEYSVFCLVSCLSFVASKQQLSTADLKMDDLYDKFNILQYELMSVNAKLRSTMDDNLLMKKQMDKMSKELNFVRIENADMKKHVFTLQTKFDMKMNHSNRICDGKHSGLGASTVVQDLNKRLLIPEATNHRVAFSAALTHDQSLGYHQAVEYDKVITNEGSAYDSNSGHFIAPYKGLYLLSATVVNVKGYSHHIEIVRNGQQIVAFYQSPDEYNFESQTVVVVLEKGDKIWVRRFLEQSGTGYIRGTVSLLYNTFSGVLLFNMV